MIKINSLIKFFPKFLLPYARLINNSFFRGKVVPLKKVNFIKNNSTVTVLGNGPSLSRDLSKIRLIGLDSDIVCVNNFSCTEFYDEFKPNMYVFFDDYFFSENAHIDWVKQRELTFKNINDKTTWPMTIIVPAQASLRIINSNITNKNVSVVKINTVSFRSRSQIVDFIHYDTGLFGPFQGNVLIYSIFLSLFAGYKDIKLFGADMSFHNNIKVDQYTNELYINFTHFGQIDTCEKFLKNPEKIEPFKTYEFFELTAETFYAHKMLNEYALKKGSNILNLSSDSFIDSYTRGGG